MNPLFPRLARGASLLKNTRFFSTSSTLDKFAPMPALDIAHFMATSNEKKILVPTAQLVSRTFQTPQEEMVDADTAACLSNFQLASLVDMVDATTQYDNILECTSVLRKRRGKMNRHKLKKRRRRERFSTRRTTTA